MQGCKLVNPNLRVRPVVLKKKIFILDSKASVVPQGDSELKSEMSELRFFFSTKNIKSIKFLCHIKFRPNSKIFFLNLQVYVPFLKQS